MFILLRSQHLSITKMNLLVLFKEITGACSENRGNLTDGHTGSKMRSFLLEDQVAYIVITLL
jgi:hypothetical protein